MPKGKDALHYALYSLSVKGGVIVGAEKKVKCPWCQEETVAAVSTDKSEYGDVVIRRCGECNKVISSYLDEGKVVLEKVRTFQ